MSKAWSEGIYPADPWEGKSLANPRFSLASRAIIILLQLISLMSLLSRSYFARFAARRVGFIASILLIFNALQTNAAELHLSNGDRVTGTVVLRADGKIHFRSDLLGDLVVAESDAAIIETPETPVEPLSGLPPTPKSAPKPKKTAVAAATTTPDQAGVDAVPPPKWKGKVEFGFLNQSGRSEVLNTSLRAEAEYKAGVDSYRATGRYLYGENNGVIASNRTDASFRWRRDLSQRVFAQSLTSYTRDQITQIDNNVEQNGSLGYQVLKNEQHVVNAGAGLTLQYREAEGLEPGLNFLGEVFQDYTYKINGRLTVSQALNALYSPNGRARSISSTIASSKLTDEAENYKVRFNSTLQGKMSERISLNLRYEYEYDNAVLDKEARSDQRITSSIGYAF